MFLCFVTLKGKFVVVVVVSCIVISIHLANLFQGPKIMMMMIMVMIFLNKTVGFSLNKSYLSVF